MSFRLLPYFFVALVGCSAFADGFTGQLKSSTDDYPAHLGAPTEDVIPYMTFELSDKHKLSKKWRLQWKLYGLSNLSTHLPPENFYGDIPEAFVEYKAQSTLKFRAGMNTVTWGVVDISSPSDVVNTLAIFNPTRIRKQGAPMVEAVIGPEQLNLDLIYVPVQRAPQLPSADSRWLPRNYLINLQAPGVGNVQIPSFFQYEYEHPETLNHALNNNWGAKLASHLGSWDLQAVHYIGAATSPKVRPFPVIGSNLQSSNFYLTSPLQMSAVTYLVETTGVGFVWAREKWIFRGESAYSHTLSDDPILQPWSWTNVLAVETNVEVGSKTMTLLAQYYYSKNPQAADNLISSMFRIFDQTAMLGARLAYSEDLTLNLSALYEAPSEGWFVSGGFDQKLTEHLRWGLSWSNFSGSKPGILQTFAKDSHGTLDLTYFF